MCLAEVFQNKEGYHEAFIKHPKNQHLRSTPDIRLVDFYCPFCEEVLELSTKGIWYLTCNTDGCLFFLRT